MNLTLKRVFLLGLLSHVLAFSTLFAILSGISPNGSKQDICFCLTALALGLIPFYSVHAKMEKVRQRLMMGGVVILLLGLGALLYATLSTGQPSTFLLLAFAVLGFFLLRRIVQMVDDLAYIRQSLLEQYKFDILLQVAAALLVVFLARDHNWQQTTVPLFVAFLLTRMIALSFASQLNRDPSVQKSMTEKIQSKMPYLIIGIALLAGWIVVSVGGNFFMWVFTPLINIIGHGVEFLMAHLGFLVYVKIFVAKLNAWFQNLLCLLAGCSSQNEFGDSNRDGPPVKLPLQQGNWFWLEVIGGAVVFGGLAVYLVVTVRRARLPRMSEGGVEVRKFIMKQPGKAKSKAKVAIGSLSRMRRVYRKFLFAMQKEGYVRREGETALELVGRINNNDCIRHEDLNTLTDFYMNDRYRETAAEINIRLSKEILQKLNRKTKKLLD